jgi:hypothetical protein
MKTVIEHIDIRGMFPNSQSRYLVAWSDEGNDRVMIGFSQYKDLVDGCAHISYSYEDFYKDPIGKLINYLDAGIDLSRAFIKFDDYIQEKENDPS